MVKAIGKTYSLLAAASLFPALAVFILVRTVYADPGSTSYCFLAVSQISAPNCDGWVGGNVTCRPCKPGSVTCNVVTIMGKDAQGNPCTVQFGPVVGFDNCGSCNATGYNNYRQWPYPITSINALDRICIGGVLGPVFGPTTRSSP